MIYIQLYSSLLALIGFISLPLELGLKLADWLSDKPALESCEE
jgi:hypothetical protein